MLGALTVLATVCLPSAALARRKADQAICYLNLKEIGVAWAVLAEEHDSWILPAYVSPNAPQEYPPGFPDDLKRPGVWWSRLIDLGYVLPDEGSGERGLFRCPGDTAPLKRDWGGEEYQHSYVYMDYFGFAYSTNPKKWPGNGAYGLRRRRDITKHPGNTPVVLEVADGKYKRGNMIVPSGGYANLAHRLWMGLRHAETGSVLFDDGRVEAVSSEHPALTYDCRDLF